MLEMLNPTGGDVIRFAAQVYKVRKQMNAAMKQGQQSAQDLAVKLFCAPPDAARSLPDLARLKADSQRFFGWKVAQWQGQEPFVKELLESAEHGDLMHDGLRVHTYFWKATSTPKRGRILLCHGWEGYALNFALLIQHARAAGFEVHAFDHLAHGRSQGTQSGLPIALSTLLAVSKHVSQTAGPLDLLVGHSLGGAAASWAVAHGEIKPRKLALIAPFYDTHKLSGQWAKAHLLSEEIRGLLQAGLENSTGKAFADFMPDGLATHYAKHPVPTLIVHDRADKITSHRHSATLASKASNVRLHEAERLGHIAVLADDACMAQIVRFAQE